MTSQARMSVDRSGDVTPHVLDITTARSRQIAVAIITRAGYMDFSPLLLDNLELLSEYLSFRYI